MGAVCVGAAISIYALETIDTRAVPIAQLTIIEFVLFSLFMVGQLAMMWEKKSLTDSKYLFKIPNHRLAQCLSGSVGLYWFRSKCGWRLYLVSDSRLTPTATTGAHDAQHHPHKQHNHMQQHIPAIQPRRASQPRPRGKHIAQPRHPLFTVNQSAPRLARRLALIRLVGTVEVLLSTFAA